MTGLLQTTLEVDKQFALFAREVRRMVAFEGMAYRHDAEAIELRDGHRATHSATYDLVLGDASLGTVAAYRDVPFTDADVRTLENLLCALVYPLRNALAYRRAVQRALRDPLTGVANRAAFEQALARELELARRQHIPLSLLIVDIDHFKACNDCHGHSFGDDVLRAVANTVTTTVRRSDLVFRYGGEEFVVLASHTAAPGARLLAERIRENVARLRTIGGRELSLSVSVGVTAFQEDDDARHLFDRADAALYRAKAEGRDRVCDS
ncbi:MAG: GGDEF domain-containing protein [Gammaproteobacteria bacterium]